MTWLQIAFAVHIGIGCLLVTAAIELFHDEFRADAGNVNRAWVLLALVLIACIWPAIFFLEDETHD